ncbi:hypothetical protein ACWGRL_08230 [[Kitasatospora] papulosa]
MVRAELAAAAAVAAAREAELREAMRIAARADELKALRELHALDQADPGKTTKPYATSSPDTPADTSRATSTPGSPAPWPNLEGTTATRPPAKPRPAFSRRRSSHTPRTSPTPAPRPIDS